MTATFRRRLLGSALLVTLTAGPRLALADDAPRGEPGASVAVEEVVVTAEKRTERLEDVPVAVSVVSGDQLMAIHAFNLEDWAGYVPGMSLVENGAPGLETIVLDGIPPLGAASEVGLYVGDTPVGSSSSFEGANGFSIDLMPYDLQRAEILHGPQGTLYGASTMGGLVKYVLAAPDLERFSGAVGGDVFGVEHGGSVGGGVRGEVNMPLMKDTLALRVSGYDENTPGYIDDVTTGQKADNPVRQAGGRVALLWQPAQNFSAQLGAIYQWTHADNLADVALSPTTLRPMYGDLSNINTLPEPFDQSLQLYDLTLNWKLPFGTLTSVTSYQSFANQTTEDITPYIGVYLGFFGAPGPGDADFHEDYRLKKWTQEVRLASPTGQKLEWLGGFFYTHEAGENYEVFNGYTAPGVSYTGYTPIEAVMLPSTYEEVAVFGDATYHFTDWFDVTGGARYAHNTQNFEEYEGGLLLGSLNTFPLTVPGHSSEGVWTWAVSPEVHFNKQTMAYFRVATGYQPGGPNVVLPGVSTVPLTFASSRLTDYQLGLKANFLDGRGSVDLSTFYIDWSKIQVGVLIGNESAIENAGSARSEGFDASGTFTPIRGLTLGASLTYADAILTAPIASIGVVSGARLPYVPMWAGSLSVAYVRPLAGPWDGFIGGGWRYTGSRYSAPEGAYSNGVPSNPQGVEASAYGVLDLHLGARTHDFSVSLFAKNLTDRRAYLAPVNGFYDAINSPIDLKAPVLQPRTIGLSVDKTF